MMGEQVADMGQGTEARHAVGLVDGNDFSSDEIHGLIKHYHAMPCQHPGKDKCTDNDTVDTKPLEAIF